MMMPPSIDRYTLVLTRGYTNQISEYLLDPTVSSIIRNIEELVSYGNGGKEWGDDCDRR